MSHLIFVRHSAPDIRLETKASNWKLSTEGIRLSRLLAKQLESLEPNIVISSPEDKAQQTGAIVAKHLMIPHQTEVDIREHEVETTEFLSPSVFDASVYKLFEFPAQLVFGNETANQALHRFTKAVNQHAHSEGEVNTILVTHGRILSLFVSVQTGTHPYEFWKSLSMPAFVVFELPNLTMIQKVNVIDVET
jgi:broad specificity phosphatase PhoE